MENISPSSVSSPTNITLSVHDITSSPPIQKPKPSVSINTQTPRKRSPQNSNSNNPYSRYTSPVIKSILKIDPVSERLYNSLIQIADIDKINLNNIVYITITLMQVVDNFEGIHGEHKKWMIIRVMRKFIEENMKPTYSVEVLKQIVDTMVPSMIDSMIGINNKELSIKKSKSCMKVFKCC
jgi:hypothetical protein